MALCRPMRNALVFEELEPRLLFSADLAMGDTEVAEQDYAEEPVVTADLESSTESDGTAALQEDDGSEGSTGPESTADEMETLDGEDGATEETGGQEELQGSGTEDTGDEAQHSPPVAESHTGGQGDPADGSADESAAVPMAGPGGGPNLAPVLTQPDGPFDYAGGDLLIAPSVTVTDDSGNFKGGTLTVSITEGDSIDDRLLIVEGGEVSIVGNSNIKVDDKMVGHFAGGTDGSALVISWTPQATPERAEAVLRQIGFSNSSAEPASGSRTVDFVLTDGDGGTSNTVHSIVDVGDIGAPGDPGENIAPVLTQPGGPVDYASGGQAVRIAPAATVVDVDSADFKQGTLSVSFSQGGTGDDQLLIVEGGGVSIVGNSNIKVDDKLVGHFAGGTNGTALVISWTPQATPVYAEAVLRQIGYNNGSAAPVPGSRTVDFVLTDGDGGTSNTVQTVINVTEGSGEPPGEDPGEGEPPGEDPGEGEGDPPGGGVTPPADEPIDEPIDEPVDGQVDTPEPVGPGSGGQEQGATGDNSGTLPPSVPPVSDTVAPEVKNETVGGSADTLPAAGIRQEEPDALWEVRVTDTRIATESRGADEGPTFPAAAGRTCSASGAPAADGSAVADMADGSAIGLPEQSVAHAGQGYAAGDATHEETLAERLKTTVGRLLGFLAPSSATAAPVALSDADSGSSHGTPADNNDKVCREVEIMRQEMEEAFQESHKADRLMAYTTTGASLSLAAGIARYFFHSGSLLSGFLATIPLWKGFDPVAILSTPKIEPKKAGATAPAADVETVEQKAETMFAAGGKT